MEANIIAEPADGAEIHHTGRPDSFGPEQQGELFLHSKRKRHINQASRVVALSFAGIILGGTVLLLLPFSSRDGGSCGLMTALFTATSASCVTGLSLVDTMTFWSPFGQAVILAMIQLGGLSFMTMIFLLAFLTHRKLSLNQRLMMTSAYNLEDMTDLTRVMTFGLKLTLSLEGAGAVILSACFIPRYGWAGIWKGVFTSVSAFCNAGFDLMGPDGAGSLSSYAGNPAVLLTVSALVVCGGLGFFVWEEISSKRSYRRLSMYSKMVIWITGLLLVLGMLFFLCAEWNNPGTMGAMPPGERILNSLFQSVTLRTAGFTTISQENLTDVSVLMSILLMLVGGSSGSTAGGIKTVTLGVLILALYSCIRGRNEVTFRGRTIPHRKVLAALTLVLMIGFVFLICSMVIAILGDVPYMNAAYETASAIATVGLSTGITAELSLVPHLILIALMYLGRVGVLSFSLAFLTENDVVNKISYPETNIIIG